MKTIQHITRVKSKGYWTSLISFCAISILFVLSPISSGCGGNSCKRNIDCGKGNICQDNSCQPAPNNPNPGEDGGIATNNDKDNTTPDPGNTPDASAPDNTHTPDPGTTPDPGQPDQITSPDKGNNVPDPGKPDKTPPNKPATGFAKASKNWAVPNLSGVRGGAYMTNRFYGNEIWDLIDINGDGKPDLVWSSQTTGRKPWGTDSAPYWKVYLNDGQNFSAVAKNWPVPVFQGVRGGAYMANRFYGNEIWNLIDINGDKKPDLVWTSQTTGRKPWGTDSAPYWKVYLNTGNGFASSPKNWTIPVFQGVRGGAYIANRFYGNEIWNLMDMNGDGKPDLVWSSQTTGRKPWGDGVTNYWKVYLNNGSNFSQSAQNWAVPNLSGVKGGVYIANRFYGNEIWSTLDLNGDKLPDLVWSSQTTGRKPWGTGSAPYWKVYLNDGQNFSALAKNWPVPALQGVRGGAYMPNRFYGNEIWSTLDLNGDGKLDLVWTSQTTGRKPWGTDSAPYWKVFTNTGSGFASSSSNWSVPALQGVRGGAYQTARFYGNEIWSTLDMNGDKKPDFVWTSQTTGRKPWGDGVTHHWKIFHGE